MESIQIEFNGIAGSAGIEHGMTVFRGKWASHTGYHSGTTPLSGIQGNASTFLYEKAEALYRTQAEYAFAVGDEHKENGWKTLSESLFYGIEVRLPYWHSGEVAALIEQYGMEVSCPHNCKWRFPPQSGVTMQQARDLLQPILQPGTRFTDEAVLCAEIDKAAMTGGFRFRKPIQQGQAQVELF